MIRLRQSGADEVLIKRVRDWYDPGPGCFFSDVTGVASFDPASLFTTGEQGVYFDSNNSATLFEDSAGTIPTALERPVGLMLDLSGRGNHATSSSTARPTLTRRVNLLSNTENMSTIKWTLNSGAIVTSGQQAPDGSLTAFRIQLAAGGFNYLAQLSNATASISTTSKVWIKSYAPGVNNQFRLNIGGVYVLKTVASIWTEYSDTATTTGVAYGFYSNANSDAVDIVVWHPDLRPTNIGVNLPAYQRVGDTALNAADYDTAGFPAWLRCSGGQSMVTPSINFTGTDKMTVWAGVRKLSDATTGAIVELSGNTESSNPGSLLMAAPYAFGARPYLFMLRGTSLVFTDNPSFNGLTAPRTDVLSSSYDIGSTNASDELKVRVDGVAQALSYNGTNAGTGSFSNYPLYLFARNQDSLFFNGLAGPIIVRGAQSSAAEIANAESWINAQQKVY